MMETNPWGDVLHDGIDIRHLPPDGSLGTLRVYQKGAVIWNRGDRCDSVFFLRRGEVCIVVTDEEGRDVVIRYVRPGEPFGLTCFSARRRESVPTKAVSGMRTEVVEIPCEKFTQFLRQDDAATHALLATLSERLAFAEERLRIVVNHHAEDRLCALLEQMAERSGKPARDNPALFRLQLTHAELAQLSGLSRAHVSIIMARLRENGIVHYGRSAPLQVDTGALKRRRADRAPNQIAAADSA